MAAALPVALVVAVAAVVGLGALHREALRRVVLGTVDPRPLALFRIGLGLCLLGYVVEIAPVATYVFSDEGLLPSAAVPQVYGRAGLAGYGDGVRAPPGFADPWAVVQHVAHGRWSLLYFWDEPAVVHAVLVALAVASVGMTIGWRTRTCTVIAWLLLTTLLRRGDAHWAGEQVLMGLLFPMMLARSGAAFGIDAWRRNRALARRGRLDRRDGPEGGRGAPPSDEHPEGLAAIYPRVPAWPQVLLVAQLALCYAANGWTKSGPTWITGDTLQLAVHMDRYARLDWHGLAVGLGAWPFRLGTWSVLWWERLFPLLLVGLWLRASAEAGAPRLVGRARTAARGCWLLLAGTLLVWATWPGALAERPEVAGPRAGALGVIALVIALWTIVGPRLSAHARARAREWVLRLLAPRWWLGFGLSFHAVSLVLFEIGVFVSATVAAYVLCGGGPACVRTVQRIARVLGRQGLPVPAHLRRQDPVPTEDPTLPHLHRDAAALPGWAILAAEAIVLTGTVLALLPATQAIAWWHGGWLLAAAGLVVVGWPTARHAPATPPEGLPPLAHGPAGRLAAGGVVVYHLVALLTWQLPSSPAFAWRKQARQLVDPWMELAFTRQLWSMFAPNGPRSNVGLRTTIVDEAGVVHDLRTEQQHPENLPRPYLWHDRWRKIEEGLSGGRAQLVPWHARYLCRRWALEHDAVPPTEVRLERVSAPFPPMRPLDPEAWFWAHAKVEPLVHVRCAEEPFAQLDPEIRRRHGLPPPSPDELVHAWARPRPPDPFVPLWVALALGLGAVVVAWSRAKPAVV